MNKIMLNCSKCKRLLDTIFFGTRNGTPRGYRSSCKECTKKNRADYYIKYYSDNRDKILQYIKEYYSTGKGKERGKINRGIYKARNRHIGNAYGARRRFARKHACPKWLTQFDLNYMQNIYLQSQVLTTLTGEQHEVDHIVPLFKGGAESDENRACLCRRCHKKKSDLEEKERAGG